MNHLLQQLGLSEKAAQVYMALLELGDATVSSLATKASLNRTTLYDILPDLVQRGLVSRVAGKKKDTYAPEPPEKLVLMVEEKVLRAQEELAAAKKVASTLKLLTVKQPNAPKVQLFQGKPGIKSLYEDTLLSAEVIRSFSSTESLEGFDQAYLHRYYKRRAQKKVFIKAIINDVPTAHEYQKEDATLYRELRIVPKGKMDIRPEVYVYDNKVAFFSLREELAVLIESYDIATALKKLYDLAWVEAGRENTRLQK
jgi:sugar-specific transcriptional regulator TrmB